MNTTIIKQARITPIKVSMLTEDIVSVDYKLYQGDSKVQTINLWREHYIREGSAEVWNEIATTPEAFLDRSLFEITLTELQSETYISMGSNAEMGDGSEMGGTTIITSWKMVESLA